MRSRTITWISVLVALAVAILLPWLAWQEAQRQAWEAAAEMTRAYARAVLHRADQTAGQADAAMRRLASLQGEPCSTEALALMRQLDLTSTYVQAVGFVRGDTIVCSSMGSVPVPLGKPTLRTSRGVAIHSHVPLASAGASPLMALERGGFAALLHLEAAAGAAPELTKGWSTSPSSSWRADAASAWRRCCAGSARPGS